MLRLVGNYIANLEFVPVFSGSGHLQIVRDLGGNGRLIEAEVQSGSFVTLGDWVFQPFGQLHGGPTAYIDENDVIENADRYASTTIALASGQEEEYVWELLQQFHESLARVGADLDYDSDQNSNSYVNTALSVVGVQLAPLLSDVLVGDITSYPGSGTNVLQGAKTGPFSGNNVALSIELAGTDGNDTVSLGIGDDIVGVKRGDDIFDGGGGRDVALFSGSCLEYNISKAGDGTITVVHARGNQEDGTDTLSNVEIARFANGKEVDLTLNTLFGCSTLAFVQDFVTGTTQDTQVVFDLVREGDTSYPIQVFVDGQVTTGNAVFNDFFYTIQPGDSPQLIIGASVAEVFGDVAFDFAIDIKVVDPVFPFVEILDGTAGGVLIGDRVDIPGGLAWGDPHLVTFDNVAYDFHAAGEFVLTRATAGDNYEVQARFVAISSAISVTQAIATRVGDTVVAIEAGKDGGTLRLDDIVTVLAGGDEIAVGGGSVRRTGNRIEIDHGNGDRTTVDIFSTFVSATPSPSIARSPGSLEGLLGDADGNPGNDFRLSGGTILTTPIPVGVLYSDFSQSWAVSAAESMLPGAPEPFDAPDRIVTIDSLPEALLQAAEQAVDAAGITNPKLREAAILDFALTNDPEYLEAAGLVERDFEPIVGTTPVVPPIVNPVVVLTSDHTVVDEEDAATRTVTFTVARGSSSGDLAVHWVAAGVGSTPADGQDFSGATSGAVTLADGADSVTFSLDVANDHFDEGTEAFRVDIQLNPVDQAAYEVLIETVRLTIVDDDVAPARVVVVGSAGRDTLIGTRLDELLRGLGGPLDLITTGDGADDVDFTGLAGNGVRDVTRILDYTPGQDRLLGIDEADIVRAVSVGATTTLFLAGADRDQVIVTGVSTIADIIFADAPIV